MSKIERLLNEYTEIQTESHNKLYAIEKEIGKLFGGGYGRALIILEHKKWTFEKCVEDYFDAIVFKDIDGFHHDLCIYKNKTIEKEGYVLFNGKHLFDRDQDNVIFIFKLENKVENLDD